MAQSAPAPRRTTPRASDTISRRSTPIGRLARLLAGISTGATALAISLSPGAVRAATAPGGGAVNGTPTVQFGVGSISRTPTLDTVTVNAKDALIDWASNDPNVYLPVAKTLQFTGITGAPYTILNRVDAAGPLQINGTVTSDANGAAWFYNPGGWVVGSTGIFNVGSLVLSASPVSVTAGAPDGQQFVDSKGAIHFTQGQPGASVIVQAGAQINASGNYVALIAPRVVQGGTVTTNGSTAYVGAEAATLTVNNGLFDITVDSGTADANGVVHTGTTTGAAATASGPAHQIALVAVPKNQVLTMLVSGNLGYTAANVAQGEVDGTIVLGAGYNVAGGAVGTNTFEATGGSARLSALTATNETRVATTDSLTIDATGSSVVFAKSLLGSAYNAISINAAGTAHTVSTGTDLTLGEYVISPSRSITLGATNGGTISVGGKTDLFNATGPQPGVIAINATTGGVITLGGDLAIVSSTAVNIGVADAGSKLQVGGAAAFRSSNGLITQLYGTQGGAITMSAANGASLAIAKSLDVRVDASGGVLLDPANPAQLLPGSVGVAATAGSITATNTDATFTVAGSTSFESLAYGGIGADSAGSATSGSVSFTQTGASASSLFGTVNAGGFLSLVSSGDSAYLLQYPPTFSATGAASSSGAATLSVTGGNFAAGSISVGSTANTSYGLDSKPYAATAGPASVTFANGSYSASSLSVSNSAHDYNEGVVTAGKVSVTLDNAKLDLSGFGIDVETITHGTVTTAGQLAVTLRNGSSLTTAGSAYFSSIGEESGNGPAKAADLRVTLSSSKLTASEVTVASSGTGGDISPDGTGGLASLALDSGSVLTTTGGSLLLSSAGHGGFKVTDNGDGGAGVGGTAQLGVADSTINVATDLSVTALGSAGLRSLGTARSGTGQGGNASISISGNNTALTAATISVQAQGQTAQVGEGSSAQRGGGTVGIGGTAQLLVSNGANVTATALKLDASGFGSNAVNVAGVGPAKGGTGTGGTATFTLDGSGGTIAVPTVKLDTSGYGGNGADLETALKIAAGDGGVGRGGTSVLTVFGGTLTTNSVTLDANGNQQVQGCSGDCAPNTSIIYAGVGGGVTGSISATAGAGGAGFGGTSTLKLDGGTQNGSTTAIQVNAFGQGGLGGPATSGVAAVLTRGAGGAGTGGTAQLFFDGGSIEAQRIAVNASAAGGSGGLELANVGNSTDTPANAGAGGSAAGGTAIFETSQVLSPNTPAGRVRAISVRADGFGAAGLPGLIGGTGGNGTGGFADFEINASTTVADLTVRANGAGGVGGVSTLANAGAIGGNGTGGTARIISDFGASGALSGYIASAQGTGGAGGTGGSGSATMAVAGNGGQGGSARGGSAIVEADGGSALTLNQSDTGDLIADATGGVGGNGGDAGRFGFAQRGNGAKGGDASGGSLQFIVTGGSTLDLGDASYTIRTGGGNGGEVVGVQNAAPPQPSLGGAGGRGDFGEISFSAIDAGSTIKASSLALNAQTLGGNGGDGYGTDPKTGNGTPGAVGGDASSAQISFLADFGGSIAIAPDGAVNVNAIATGGNGGDASAARAGTGGVGGRGGDGGAGFESAISLQTGTDATISFSGQPASNINANGFGGRSGDGGAGASNAQTGGDGGNGGDGGTSGPGFGGAVSLVANGGTITTGNLSLFTNGFTPIGLASGQGGAGGAGGPGATIPPEIMGQPPVIIPPGADGNGGSTSSFGPVGGTVAITASDNGGTGSTIQYGALSLGNVNANVTSQQQDIGSQSISFSGSIALKDTTNAPGTGFYAQSLTLDAGGFSDISPVGITLLSVNHPVTVADTISVNADGTVQFTGQQGGGVTAGDTIQIYSNRQINLDTLNAGSYRAGTISLTAAGNIQINSGGCPTQNCVVAHADGDFTAQSYNNQFILTGPARVEGLNSISVTAGTDILGESGSGYLSNNDVILFGGGNVQVRNVSASRLTVDAGASNTEGGVTYDGGTLAVGEDDGSGTITTGNEQTYHSGGSIEVPGGNALSAGLGITFASVNDIIVGQNAAITANVGNPATPGAIAFNAGLIAPNTPLTAGDIPSLLIGSGATIDGGAGNVTLLGAAIDARGAGLHGASFTADVTRDLSLASSQSNDGGQLSAPCLEADICLGAVTASGAVRIGVSETVPLHFLGTGSIAGGSVSMFTKGALSFGTSGQLVTITSPGAVILRSYQGDVTLAGGSKLSGASVNLSAGGSLLGNGRITATTDDIGITVGKDIVADALVARQLTASGLTGDPIEPLFMTPGSLTVGMLTLRTAAAIQVGGDIVLGQANLGGNALTLTASGRTSLQATGGVTNLTLAGQNVDFGTIAASGFITANATNALTGTSAAAGTMFTGGGSMIAIRAITSGTDSTLRGDAMTLGTVDADSNLAIMASGAVSLDRGAAAKALAVTASSLTAPVLTAGGDAKLLVTNAATLGTLKAGGNIVIDPTVLSFTALTSGGSTAIVAGDVLGGTIDAGTNIMIDAMGRVVLERATATTTLAIGATTITAPALTSGGGMTLKSSGAIALGTANASGDLAVTAASTKFTAFKSTGATTITGGAVSGGTIAAGTALAIASGGAIALDSATSGTAITLSGSTITSPALTAGGALSLTSSGLSTLGAVNSGASVQIAAKPLAYGTITASGPITISATAVNGGAITSNRDSLSITSTGAVNTGALASTTDTTISAGTLAFPSLNAAGNVKLLVTNDATLGTVKAGGNIIIDPTVLSFTALTSGGSTAIVAGDVLGGTIDAGTSITIDATGRVVLDRANAATTLAIGATTIAAPALTSGGGMTLKSSGTSTLGTTNAGGDQTITVASVKFNTLKSAGATSITGGDVSGGTIAAGTALAVASTGAIALDSASSDVTMTLASTTIAATSLTSGGAMMLTSTGATTLGSVISGAGLQIAAKPLGYGAITAAGPIAIAATAVKGGAITSSRSSLTITSAGAVGAGGLSSGTDITISADTLDFASLNAGGSATLTANNVSGNPISAAQDVSVTSGSALAFQMISAGRNATLIASAGNVTVSTDFAVGGTASVAGDAVTLNAKGPLSIGSIVARGGDIVVTSGGPLSVSNGQAIGNLTLTAQQGALTLGRLAAGYKPTSTLGNVNGGNAAAARGPGNITLSAPGSIAATGTIDSAAALVATTSGAISLGALTVGNTIALTSSDLAIAATALLGQARTTALSLTNNGNGGMVLGDGFDSPDGYLVSNAEFGRIHSGGNLTIDAGTSQSTSTMARLTIGTLLATAANGTTEGNVASDGTLTLRSGNGVAVLGAATLANAASNTLALAAAGDLMIDAARGSVRLIEGNGHGGTLSLNASRVLAVTPQALTDISAATTTAAITTRLSVNDGVTAGATLLEAGALKVNVLKGFYVQNTAPLSGFDDRRGLVSDSLAVIATGTTPITIVANGLVNGLSGLKAIPVTTITGSFDPQSSLNGCVILAVATCNKPVGFTNPIQDVISDVLGGPLGAEINSIPLIGDGFFNAPLMAINQITPIGFTPLIDEPVSGTGNDDLESELTLPPLRPALVRKKSRTHSKPAAP
jgi:filamentous hemagglutinin family protein